MSQTFHCPNCGAPLELPAAGQAAIRCAYCQSSIIVPPELRQREGLEEVLSPLEALANLPELSLVMREVVRLTREGKKLEAIKELHDHFEIGLKEAKDAVEQIERGEMVQLANISIHAPAGITTTSTSVRGPDMEEIMALLQAGNKIEAIKRFREITGLGLKESKDAIEALELPLKLNSATDASAPVVTAAKATAAVTGGVSCLVGIILAVTLIFTAIGLFFGLTAPGSPLEEFGLKLNPFSPGKIALAFGDEGTGAGMFKDPRGIGVGVDGSIFVSDFDTGRIQRFNADGEYQGQWLIPGEPYIQSLDVDRNGIVYIVYEGQVHRFDGASGEEIQPPIQFEQQFIDHFTVAPDGSLAAILSGETLVRMEADSDVIWALEDSVSIVTNDSELSAVVAVDGLGNLYVLGSFDNGVLKYSPDGKFLTRWGAPGDEPGQLRAASAIAVDGQGRVYISDIKGIQVFDSDGRYLHKLEVKGYAFGLDFNDAGELFVVSNAPRVYRYTLE